MSSADTLRVWDDKRRKAITRVLFDHGFRNITLPPSPYDMIAKVSLEEITPVESKVTWGAVAESYTTDNRIKNIEIFVYFRFNVEKKDITVQFRVTRFDADSSMSKEEIVKIYKEQFEVMSSEIEKQLIDNLKIYGVWGSP